MHEASPRPVNPAVFTISRAAPGHGAALTALACAAKRHWGYPESWLRRWQPELTVTPAYIRRNPTFVARCDQTFVGFVAIELHGDAAVLDHLWVRPDSMGRGIGRALFLQAEDCARAAGAMRLTVTSDPHAEGFYRRMGATKCGDQPAPMDGEERLLPRLEKPL